MIEFFDRRMMEGVYSHECELLKRTKRPSASRCASQVMTNLLSSFGISPESVSFAWTESSKAIRVRDSTGACVVDSHAKPLTPGRRHVLYVKLPSAIPDLGFEEGDFLGVVGDISTQSTSVITESYFLCRPGSVRVWYIFASIHMDGRNINISSESLVERITSAAAKSDKTKRQREYRPRIGECSGSGHKKQDCSLSSGKDDSSAVVDDGTLSPSSRAGLSGSSEEQEQQAATYLWPNTEPDAGDSNLCVVQVKEENVDYPIEQGERFGQELSGAFAQDDSISLDGYSPDLPLSLEQEDYDYYNSPFGSPCQEY